MKNLLFIFLFPLSLISQITADISSSSDKQENYNSVQLLFSDVSKAKNFDYDNDSAPAERRKRQRDQFSEIGLYGGRTAYPIKNTSLIPQGIDFGIVFNYYFQDTDNKISLSANYVVSRFIFANDNKYGFSGQIKVNRFFRVNDFAAFLSAGFDIQLPRNSVGFPDEKLFSPSAGIGMEYNIGRISPFLKFDRRFIFSNTYFFDGGIKFRI